MGRSSTMSAMFRVVVERLSELSGCDVSSAASLPGFHSKRSFGVHLSSKHSFSRWSNLTLGVLNVSRLLAVDRPKPCFIRYATGCLIPRRSTSRRGLKIIISSLQCFETNITSLWITVQQLWNHTRHHKTPIRCHRSIIHRHKTLIRYHWNSIRYYQTSIGYLWNTIRYRKTPVRYLWNITSYHKTLFDISGVLFVITKLGFDITGKHIRHLKTCVRRFDLCNRT